MRDSDQRKLIYSIQNHCTSCKAFISVGYEIPTETKNAVLHTTTKTRVKIEFHFEFYVTGTAYSYYLFYRGNIQHVNKNYVKNWQRYQMQQSLPECLLSKEKRGISYCTGTKTLTLQPVGANIDSERYTGYFQRFHRKKRFFYKRHIGTSASEIP